MFNNDNMFAAAPTLAAAGSLASSPLVQRWLKRLTSQADAAPQQPHNNVPQNMRLPGSASILQPWFQGTSGTVGQPQQEQQPTPTQTISGQPLPQQPPAPEQPAAPPQPIVSPQPSPMAPQAPETESPMGLSWFQRNAFMQRDPSTGDFLDPSLAQRALGSFA